MSIKPFLATTSKEVAINVSKLCTVTEGADSSVGADSVQ